jgi:hypothetical protein
LIHCKERAVFKLILEDHCHTASETAAKRAAGGQTIASKLKVLQEKMKMSPD